MLGTWGRQAKYANCRKFRIFSNSTLPRLEPDFRHRRQCRVNIPPCGAKVTSQESRVAGGFGPDPKNLTCSQRFARRFGLIVVVWQGLKKLPSGHVAIMLFG